MNPIVKYSNVVLSHNMANGFSFFPFIFIRKSLKDTEKGKIVLQHESIHFQQQIETLVIGFYFIYLFNFIINLFKYKTSYDAYANILFEKEAFGNENNESYLETRKRYIWLP